MAVAVEQAALAAADPVAVEEDLAAAAADSAAAGVAKAAVATEVALAAEGLEAAADTLPVGQPLLKLSWRQVQHFVMRSTTCRPMLRPKVRQPPTPQTRKR